MEGKEEQIKDQLNLSLQTQLHLHNKQPPDEGEKPPAKPFPSIDEVEEIIGYSFRDKSLLTQAFTHATWPTATSSYERLEYVGDSVLNLLISREDYFAYPDLQPGKLTRLRAANVDTEKLARVAVKLNLHNYLLHKKPLLDAKIREFMDAIAEYPLHSSGLINVPKVLADIVESTIGAIFIDSNSSLDTTWKVVERLLEPIITPKTLQMHPVTKVNELCQKHGLKLQYVDLWKETGEIEVFVDNEFVERATYTSKRLIAQNRAANKAYKEIMRKLSAEENNSDHGLYR